MRTDATVDTFERRKKLPHLKTHLGAILHLSFVEILKNVSARKGCVNCLTFSSYFLILQNRFLTCLNCLFSIVYEKIGLNEM